MISFAIFKEGERPFPAAAPSKRDAQDHRTPIGMTLPYSREIIALRSSALSLRIKAGHVAEIARIEHQPSSGHL